MDNLWIIYGKSMHNLWINKKNLMKYIVCFKYIYIYVTSTLMRQLIFSLLSLCRQDLFEVFFPGTVSNKLYPFQEVVCFLIYLLSWLWFFQRYWKFIKYIHYLLVPSQLKHNRFKCIPIEPIVFFKIEI